MVHAHNWAAKLSVMQLSMIPNYLLGFKGYYLPKLAGFNICISLKYFAKQSLTHLNLLPLIAATCCHIFFLKMTMFDGACKCHKTTKVLSKTTQILQLFFLFYYFFTPLPQLIN